MNSNIELADDMGIACSIRLARAPSELPRAGLFSMANLGNLFLSDSLWLAIPIFSLLLIMISIVASNMFSCDEALGGELTNSIQTKKCPLESQWPLSTTKNYPKTGSIDVRAQSRTTRTQNFTFNVAVFSTEPPCSVATFVINSEPHTRARPLARL
jgi:hypothetical protein